MKYVFARLFYTLILLIFYVVELALWLNETLIKSSVHRVVGRTKPLKREWAWGQKLGLLPWPVNNNSSNTVLIHCASMGEVVTATALLKALLEGEPNLHLVISTNTLTGKEQVRRLQHGSLSDYKHRIQHCYLPLDFGYLGRKLIAKVRPKQVIILEVELWPNFIRQCYLQKRPVTVINGRMTDKTRKGYLKLAWLSLPMIQQLTQVFVRNQMDKDNYLALGMASQNLLLKGNIKLDIPLPALNQSPIRRRELGIEERLVILAGSTHGGEETLLLEAYQQLKPSFPELALILVPRHPQRFEQVMDLASKSLKAVRYSESSSLTPAQDVLVVDQMGILSGLYAVCDIAFVGGSFAKRGGHNPIEPASFAKPVVMGPHIYNNPEICDVLSQAGGLAICPQQYELFATLNQLLADKAMREKAGHNGREVISKHNGLVVDIITTMQKAK